LPWLLPGEGSRAARREHARGVAGVKPSRRDLHAGRARSAFGRRTRRRGEATAFQFTPATTQAERSRAVRVAVRVRPGVTMAQRARPSAPGMAAATTETPSGTPIAPSTYNLGVAVGWRRFAITGESSNSSGGAGGGSQESSKIAVDYRATPRLTARVQVAAEKADGVQRIVTDEQAVALDVGGSFSIARGIDVTGRRALPACRATDRAARPRRAPRQPRPSISDRRPALADFTPTKRRSLTIHSAQPQQAWVHLPA
jgi:hypothetical protein